MLSIIFFEMVPAEGLLGLRPRPFGAASGLRPAAFNLARGQVVEPVLFYVGGSNCARSSAPRVLRYWARDRDLPAEGFEPPTYGLQNRCTTTVLSRRGRGSYYSGQQSSVLLALGARWLASESHQHMIQRDDSGAGDRQP